ncbi:MAG: carbohydrate kinase family protein, partial [Xanthomonadales bacterium]|nr:carbohydrate kinase family protein [Xanthomonadales bacterium]
MRALICGSLAYDTIMVFQDRFANHILPDKVHMLSVAFYVPQMRREFGGCSGNISYNLKLLGGEPVPFGAVGQDFAPYRAHMQACGIGLDHVRQLDDCFTAQAFITTDLDDNQITAFHPGAMQRSHEVSVDAVADVQIAIVAPDNRDAMLNHARDLSARGIPFIFDPGQAMPLFNGDDLIAMIEQADWVTVNDYEFALIQERTGLSAAEIAPRV